MVYRGDFNILRFPKDKLGGCRLNSNMRRFSDFIQAHHLIDPPLVGVSYTWSNHQERLSMSRLNKFLFSSQWEDHFLRVKQIALPKPMSDHLPILLKQGGYTRSRALFRFELMWMEYFGFKDRVKE